MRIVHFKHSGVMVETGKIQLYFDIISPIDDFVDHNKLQYFFISHSHGDHFSKAHILNAFEDRTYITSCDVILNEVTRKFTIKPSEYLKIDDLHVYAYDSSDLGVAFAIQVENLNVFFAGDLNWWHWENAGEEAHKAEEKLYKDILDSIGLESFDIAFLPVDPRLGDAYSWAGEYFLRKFDVKYFVPIHFGNQFGITKKFKLLFGHLYNIHEILNENTIIEL